ncbi:adenosylcobinamide-GDP ribazoletransferase [Domibacillus robiginosus]|uniref:adenosylcobinamide-GDP ribazoletransferase n=1 Tax=Domibacillus robiginosus TaxID=1071054 RepID=UPI00067CAD4A|nr:adenosylcobinamide-GDP ribazoletransferase [Domibacillus robiginosus]
MKSYLYAAGILVQFFTVFPLHRTLPMEQAERRAVLHLLPLLGLIKGTIYAGAFWVLLEWSPFSTLSIAFLVWLLPIVLTGGLHLDGWMDWADAHFSFRDKEKRLAILKDPHMGAFGVLALIVLLASKFLFIYETVHAGSRHTSTIVLIPFFAQTLTGLLLQYAPSAKQEGLAAFFQKGRSGSLPAIYSIFFVMMMSVYALHLLFWIMAGVFFLYFIWVKATAAKEFGGITGDLLGASQEGAELLLWMIVWLSVFFGTG